MRVWIDRTNDGLSGMPADSITLPLKRGTSARPAGAARTLGYLNGATGRNGGMANAMPLRFGQATPADGETAGGKGREMMPDATGAGLVEQRAGPGLIGNQRRASK